MKGDINHFDLTAEEVKDILRGKVTSLYRSRGLEEINWHPDKNKFITALKISPGAHALFVFEEGDKHNELHCPFGTEDDILWGRETWEDYSDVEQNKEFSDPTRDEFLSRPNIKSWPSPAFMPKAACRIFLKIKAIQPAQLQDLFKEKPPIAGWERNKWVFVIDFERIDPPQYALQNKRFARWAIKAGITI